MNLNNFSPDQLQEARLAASEIEKILIEEIKSGKIVPNDKERYISYLENCIEKIESGEWDSNFTIWQRMYSFLTGECPAFLPKSC